MLSVEYNDNTLAVAYARYSSVGQNEASIPQQLSEIRAAAAAVGLTIVKEYTDPAFSGLDKSRPDYLRMLAELPIIQPSTVMLYKNDRLGRDRAELARAKDEIEACGCRLYLCREGGYLPTGSGGVMMSGMLDTFAAWYSSQLSENVKRGMRWNAERGLSLGHTLLGYRRGADKKYELDPTYAPVIARIFNDYADGKRLQDICDDLNREGIPSKKGGPFTINALRAILKNDKYTGIYREAGVEIVGGMPAIVTKETYERVQQRFGENKRNGGKLSHGIDESSDYWLTGKLFCGHCRQSMRGVSGTGKQGKKHYYYECKSKKKPPRCDKRNERKQQLEDAILTILRDILSSRENLLQIAADASQHYQALYVDDELYLQSLEAQYRETDKALANVMKAIERGIITDTTERRLVELEEQRRKIEQAIITQEALLELVQDETSIRHYFERFLYADLDDPTVRDYVFDYFISRIYVYDDYIDVLGTFYECEYPTLDVLDSYMDDGQRFVRFVYDPATTRSYELSFYQGFFIIRAPRRSA